MAVVVLLAQTVPGVSVAQVRTDVAAPHGIISGSVLTADRDAPLGQALVTLVPVRLERAATSTTSGDGPRDSGLSRRTGDDGRYRFTGIAPGRYRIVITRTGYEPRFLEVEVSAAQGLRVSATLEVEAVAVQPLRQDTTAVVTGRVVDVQTQLTVANVEVSVEGTEIRSVTDAEGRYWLVRVPPGPQTLRTRRIGYAMNRVPVTVPRSGTVTQDISIAASALLVEGITVTGDAVSRAQGELATATVIEIEAIRHQTATSLAGVLELVPGVELQPPGLDNTQQIPLRAAATSGSSLDRFGLGGGTSSQDLAAFGTLIILDDVPVSNNANLQSLGPTGELSFTTSAAGGIDLRRIPASTLERVEVIRGVPSARWGDLTQGAIIVETRAGEVDPEVRGQLDVRTNELSFVGGRTFGSKHTGTLTFDFADTRSEPGFSDNRAYRLAAQLKHRAEVSGNLQFETGVDFYQLFDDRPENPNTGSEGSFSQSRDRGLRVVERARLRLGHATRMSFTGALTMVQQRTFSESPKGRGALPLTNRVTEGRQEGRFVMGSYTARVDVDGNPGSGYGRLELKHDRALLGMSHEMRTGLELRSEWNTGPGTQFDIEYPPQVTFNSVNGFDRPRSNDDVPGLATSSFYADDHARLTLWGMLVQTQAGVRVDLLHAGSFWSAGVRDVFVQPRFSFSVDPLAWLRLKGGWGRTAKTPSMASMYPAPQYYDVVNVNYYTDDPAERLAVLSTFIRDPTNSDLAYSRATKSEAGVELTVGRSVVSLVAFRDRIDGGVGFNFVPTLLVREHFALTDSVIGNGIKPDIIEPAERADTVPVLIYRPDNVLTQKNRGFELIASFPEWRPIRTRLQVTGAWVKTDQKTDALYFGNAASFSDFQLLEHNQRIPYWEGATEVGERVLLTYRVIHHQAHAGLLLTATVQHNVREMFEDIAGTDTLAYLGYLTRDARLVPVPETERGAFEYRDLRQPRTGTLDEPVSTPADWLLSVQVSKTLPLDGRLNFWAFNLLDRRGIGSRPYRAVRVGLEVAMPARALLP